MSKKLDITKFGTTMSFAIDDSGKLLLLGISDKPKVYAESKNFTALEIRIPGTNPAARLGVKHIGESMPYILKYMSHEETDNEVIFTLESELLSAKLHYEFYEDAKVIRAYSVVENISKLNICMEYISSFCLYGFDMGNVYIPHNSWCQELNWREYTPWQLGFNPDFKNSMKRISRHATGTQFCSEHSPMGAVKSNDEIIFWQIEHNGSWQWEMSDLDKNFYLKLSGPTEQENGWSKVLKPGDKFETVKAAVCVVKGGFDDAVNEMTKYRRHIAYRSPKDKKLPVVFNDYMGCIWADPTTEKELPVIDVAAKLGAEVYCMDAGWYADGTWWETVGEWKVFEKRFPNGMKEVFDYIRSKGMIPGIWVEPEVMGINCPILDQFDDDCFFMRHGQRVIDRGRYQLDFRNKKVTDFLDGVIDGLIRDYGIGFFKFDYNIDAGIGTEVDSDSFGDGLLQCNNAYLKWIDGLYERHPDLIIESCASGGLRMDYKTLSHFSIQSMSDSEDYRQAAPIAAMANTAVIPEQASIWCIPRAYESLGEIAYSVVNAMFKRIYVSGESHLLNDEQYGVLKEGVDFYKSTRARIGKMKHFYPLGFCHYEDEWICSGFDDTENNEKFLCLGRLSGNNDSVTIPVADINSAEVVYPSVNDAKLSIKENSLTVGLNERSAVVIKLK